MHFCEPPLWCMASQSYKCCYLMLISIVNKRRKLPGALAGHQHWLTACLFNAIRYAMWVLANESIRLSGQIGLEILCLNRLCCTGYWKTSGRLKEPQSASWSSFLEWEHHCTMYLCRRNRKKLEENVQKGPHYLNLNKRMSWSFLVMIHHHQCPCLMATAGLPCGLSSEMYKTKCYICGSKDRL